MRNTAIVMLSESTDIETNNKIICVIDECCCTCIFV